MEGWRQRRLSQGRKKENAFKEKQNQDKTSLDKVLRSGKFRFEEGCVMLPIAPCSSASRFAVYLGSVLTWFPGSSPNLNGRRVLTLYFLGAL
jgi:hypothetical protein